MYPSYLPQADGPFATWLQNFATRVSASPGTYNLSPADAIAVSGVNTAFQAAYTAASDPVTRTSVTVAAKDTARAQAELVVRPLAVAVSQNSAVSDADKTDLGVTVRSLVPTPIPAPVDAPVLSLVSLGNGTAKLGYEVAGSVGKAKPFGAVGVEIRTAIGVAHTVDPEATTYRATVTRSPFRLSFSAVDAGSKLTVFARFVTRSGPGGVAQSGPWSAPLQTVVA